MSVLVRPQAAPYRTQSLFNLAPVHDDWSRRLNLTLSLLSMLDISDCIPPSRPPSSSSIYYDEQLPVRSPDEDLRANEDLRAIAPRPPWHYTTRYIEDVLPGETEHLFNRALAPSNPVPRRPYTDAQLLDQFSSIIVHGAPHLPMSHSVLWTNDQRCITCMDQNLRRPIPLFRETGSDDDRHHVREKKFLFDGCYRILQWSMQDIIGNKEAHSHVDNPTKKSRLASCLTIMEFQKDEAVAPLARKHAIADVEGDSLAVSWNDIIIPRWEWARVEIEKVTDHPILSGNPDREYVIRYAFAIVNRHILSAVNLKKCVYPSVSIFDSQIFTFNPTSAKQLPCRLQMDMSPATSRRRRTSHRCTNRTNGKIVATPPWDSSLARPGPDAIKMGIIGTRNRSC